MAEASVDVPTVVPTVQTAWAQLRKDWLVMPEAKVAQGSWRASVNQQQQVLESFVDNSDEWPCNRPLLLLAEPDPAKFLAGVWAALLAGWNIALANPRWGQQEWQSVHQQICPTLILGTALPFPASSFDLPSGLVQPGQAILVPTGGTSGQVKFAHHTWSSLGAAVAGFRQYFTVDALPVNACCVLPLYHVSGLMQMLRTALSGGQLCVIDFKQLLASLPALAFSSAFISLVPTQLERLLRANRASWLCQFSAVLIGGAPCWPELLDRAIRENIPVCLSYGMTETAAMVTATTVGDSLRGDSGIAMPHAAVCIERSGQQLPVEETGQIVIRSAAIAHGYYNAPSPAFAPGTFYTDDLGYLDANGCLHVTGRASGKIISGGENIFPAEVEAAIRQTGLVLDICVFGLPHPEWGEAVAAAYVPISSEISPDCLKAALSATGSTMTAGAMAEPICESIAQLSHYKHPKQWFVMDHLPRNAQGKLNRKALLEQVQP